MADALFFWIFASVLVASAFAVIMARNPVHSVLWLILAFFNAAGLMLILGAEFIAMLLVIVYVGAVAVLFMFVTMMLDVDFAELRDGFLQSLPVGVMVGLVMLCEPSTSTRSASPAAASSRGSASGGCERSQSISRMWL